MTCVREQGRQTCTAQRLLSWRLPAGPSRSPGCAAFPAGFPLTALPYATACISVCSCYPPATYSAPGCLMHAALRTKTRTSQAPGKPERCDFRGALFLYIQSCRGSEGAGQPPLTGLRQRFGHVQPAQPRWPLPHVGAANCWCTAFHCARKGRGSARAGSCWLRLLGGVTQRPPLAAMSAPAGLGKRALIVAPRRDMAGMQNALHSTTPGRSANARKPVLVHHGTAWHAHRPPLHATTWDTHRSEENVGHGRHDNTSDSMPHPARTLTRPAVGVQRSAAVAWRAPLSHGNNEAPACLMPGVARGGTVALAGDVRGRDAPAAHTHPGSSETQEASRIQTAPNAQGPSDSSTAAGPYHGATAAPAPASLQGKPATCLGLLRL